MLVLSRHRDERIIIGDTICVTIVDIRGDKVRVGVQAPREIPVHRSEIQEAILRDQNSGESETSISKTEITFLDLTSSKPINFLQAGGMLVLSRKTNEVITIGGCIRLIIVEIRGDKVRVGLEAPANIPIHRLEVYEAIQRNKSNPIEQTITQPNNPASRAG